jgi:hypothetical protein
LGVDAAIVEPGTYPTRLGANRTMPEDSARVAPYAPAMGKFAPRFLADLAATPPDPQEVADAVARLIATPAGQRPLRTVVALAHQAAPTRALNAGGGTGRDGLPGPAGRTGAADAAPGADPPSRAAEPSSRAADVDVDAAERLLGLGAHAVDGGQVGGVAHHHQRAGAQALGLPGH